MTSPKNRLTSYLIKYQSGRFWFSGFLIFLKKMNSVIFCLMWLNLTKTSRKVLTQARQGHNFTKFEKIFSNFPLNVSIFLRLLIRHIMVQQC